MKSLIGAATIIAMIWTTHAAAQAERRPPPRGVQLISMGPRVIENGHDEAGVPKDAGSPASAAPLTPDFRVHDLRRRWVEFQMSGGLADAGSVIGPRAGQMGPDRAEDALNVEPGMAPAPAVFVPSWMRTGMAFVPQAGWRTPGCAAMAYRPAGFLSPGTELRRASYYRLMSAIACEHGIPVGLFDAMIIRESRYRTDAFSPKRAFGLTQLMPGTAASLGIDRYSVEGNLRGGARYLRQQLDSFGQYHLALAAYNAGPGRVRGGVVPSIPETQAYVGGVLSDWARLIGVYRRPSIVPQSVTGVKEADVIRPGRTASISLF